MSEGGDLHGPAECLEPTAMSQACPYQETEGSESGDHRIHLGKAQGPVLVAGGSALAG